MNFVVGYIKIEYSQLWTKGEISISKISLPRDLQICIRYCWQSQQLVTSLFIEDQEANSFKYEILHVLEKLQNWIQIAVKVCEKYVEVSSRLRKFWNAFFFPSTLKESLISLKKLSLIIPQYILQKDQNHLTCAWSTSWVFYWSWQLY